MKNVPLCAPLILTPLLTCARPSVSCVAASYDAVMSPGCWVTIIGSDLQVRRLSHFAGCSERCLSHRVHNSGRADLYVPVSMNNLDRPSNVDTLAVQ
jgi:hypothetical protein